MILKQFKKIFMILFFGILEKKTIFFLLIPFFMILFKYHKKNCGVTKKNHRGDDKRTRTRTVVRLRLRSADYFSFDRFGYGNDCGVEVCFWLRVRLRLQTKNLVSGMVQIGF